MADDLLPTSATPLQEALSLTDARVLEIDVDAIRRSQIALICPPQLVPYLGWERSVDVWRSDWPVERKRQVIAGSFAYHRTKGTRFALERALADLGYETRVREWFEYGGEPYRFKVGIVGQGVTLTLADYDTLRRTIYAAKNVRSMLEAVEVETSLQRPAPRIAAYAPRRVIETVIYPPGTF